VRVVAADRRLDSPSWAANPGSAEASTTAATTGLIAISVARNPPTIRTP
jgi:hypothetical protein